MLTGNALGVVELSGISRGYLVQDAMLKASIIEKVIAKTICSGKYLIVIKGQVADVDTAIKVAKETGGFAIINTTVIPNLDPQVFPALAGANTIEKPEDIKHIGALLVIETFSVVSAIMAADFAAKEAELKLMRIHAAMAVGGKGFVVITGELAALEAAVKPAVEYIKVDGMLADFVIIKNPHEDVLKELI
ncbi:MAG: BMC domain-containing protein [Bacteroidota bacterium]